MPYRDWILDPRWAGFSRDFSVRIERGLAPNLMFFGMFFVEEDWRGVLFLSPDDAAWTR